jgi:O-antigen/teichoic acid export membrane protein
VTIAAVTVFQVLSSWSVRTRTYTYLARRNAAQGLAQTVVQVGLGVLGVKSGLLFGSAVGRGAGSLGLARLVHRTSPGVVRTVSLSGMRAAAVRYRRFPLLSGAGAQVPILLIAGLYGSSVAGWLALANRVTGLPATMVGQAAAQVYLGEAAARARTDPARVEQLFYKVSTRLLLAAAVPAAALVVAGPPLFALVFGSRWENAGVYAQLTALAFALQLVVVPVSQTLNVLERQDLQAVWDVARLVLVCGAVVVVHGVGLGDRAAVLGYGATMLVSYVVLYGLTAYALRRVRLAASER